MTIPFLSIFSSKHKSGSSMKDYESAVKHPSRPQPATQAKDSTESLSEITHEKLVALSRYAMRNFGIVKEACQSKALYAIGDGLKPQPRSKDPEWNRKAAAIFERVFETCLRRFPRQRLTTQRLPEMHRLNFIRLSRKA